MTQQRLEATLAHCNRVIAGLLIVCCVIFFALLIKCRDFIHLLCTTSSILNAVQSSSAEALVQLLRRQQPRPRARHQVIQPPQEEVLRAQGQGQGGRSRGGSATEEETLLQQISGQIKGECFTPFYSPFITYTPSKSRSRQESGLRLSKFCHCTGSSLNLLGTTL